MIIIKYRENLLGSSTSRIVYEKVVNPNKKGTRIGQQRAEKLIEAEGLVLVVDNEYGKIWDTPDRRFLKRTKYNC